MPPSLSLGGAGAFPTAARARVLWTGVQGDRDGLGMLAMRVAAAARRARAPPAQESREYEPHLTLARCRALTDDADAGGDAGELRRRRPGPPVRST